MNDSRTLVAQVAGLAGRNPGQPLVTYYDDATGERTELSGVTVGNWIAKTANLLIDGGGSGPGDLAALWLPPHWQSAVVLLGCWSAGLTITYGDPVGADAAAGFASVEAIAGAEAAGTELAPGADRYALGLAPMGVPLSVVPAGWSDYIGSVRGQGDHYNGPLPDATTPAWVEPDGTQLTHLGLAERAAARAAELGATATDRVLVDVDAHPDPLDWLFAPLVVGASVVLCRNLADGREAEIIQSERATPVTPS